MAARRTPARAAPSIPVFGEPQTLADHCAAITGAGAGLGQAIAHVFAAAGARVLVTDRDEARAHAVAAAITAAGGHAEALRVDVTHEPDLARMVEHAEARLGPLTLAVNNAGISQLGADDDEAALRQILAVNLGGVRHAMKHELRVMRARGGGVIVNVASNLTVRPAYGRPLYSATKSAVIGLSRAVARVVAREGVRINVLCPGGIPTDMLRASYGGDAAIADLARANPTGRLATADEIARVALWMCGPEAGFMIGHPLVVDGGSFSW